MENQEQIERLASAALTSASFVKRKDSLTELVTYDHPRVAEVLRQVIAEDHNVAVRKHAEELLAARTSTPANPSPVVQPTDISISQSQPAPPSVRPARSKPAEPPWQCGFCGMENTGGDTCAYCKAARPAAEADLFEFELPEERAPSRDLFLLNLGNRAFASGQSRRMASSGYGCFMVFFIPFLVIGAIFLVYGVVSLFQWQQLSSEGVTTRGKFVDRRIDVDSDNDRTYYATFQFETNRQTYVVEQDVDSDVYNRAELGAIVDVLYLPSDPNQARVAGTDAAPEGAFILLFALCWDGIVWLVFVATLKSLRKDRVLARSGQVTPGEVVSSSGRVGSKGAYMVTLAYQFRAPETGEVISDKSTADRRDLRGQPLPAPGTPVAVAYSNRKTYKVL